MRQEAFERIFCDYLALGAKTGRVHSHKSVPPDLLVEELLKFDYGLNMQNATTFGIPWTNENPKWLPLIASGRLFDYLDAGLGMLVDQKFSFNWYLFRGSGALYDGTAILRSGRIREALYARPARDIILKAREALSAERQIHRLIRFYEAFG